jgi:HEAT repeat protein
MRKFLVVLAAVLLAAPAASGQVIFLGKPRSTWLRELAEGKPSEQRSAAFALGKLGDGSRETLDALRESLASKKPEVRDAAAFALGEIAPRFQAAVWRQAGRELRGLLGDDDKRVRRSAAFALGSCGEQAQQALADLTRVLREDREAVVRRNAAWALGRVGKGARDRGAVDGLVAALERNDEDALVLRDVAGALGEIGRPDAAPAARPLAEVVRNSRDAAVRKTALNTLVNLVDPSLAKEAEGKNAVLVQALREALREGDAESKGLVAAALANLGEHAGPAVKELAALVDDEAAPPVVRRNAVLALTRAPKAILALPENDRSAVVSKLAKALEPKQPVEVRQFTAEALARLGFPAAESALQPLLTAIREDKDMTVRHRAVWAFLNADVERLDGAKEALLGVLKTRREKSVIRYDAARALARALQGRAPNEVIDTLEEMLRDTNIKVYRQTNADVKGGSESSGGQSTVRQDLGGDARFMAAHALSIIGPPVKKRNPQIVDLLKDLARSDDEMNQKAAREALQSIGE